MTAGHWPSNFMGGNLSTICYGNRPLLKRTFWKSLLNTISLITYCRTVSYPSIIEESMPAIYLDKPLSMDTTSRKLVVFFHTWKYSSSNLRFHLLWFFSISGGPTKLQEVVGGGGSINGPQTQRLPWHVEMLRAWKQTAGECSSSLSPYHTPWPS